MSYLVLARKYRPKTFSEIIGQEPIITTLKNAIKSSKLWHSYIFAGTRGTGKTTTARLLAKVLNCLSLTPDYEPCNKCSNCVEITEGRSVDVVEIDAASNRGIDEIRALRDNVRFPPVNSKYKVYIIDEAHQITDAAFNAFLKTLEEPPPHVIFILATTEFNAFPLTIVSRCQVFQFRPVSEKEIFNRLKFILEKENLDVKISDDALYLIAENSSGSVRDALSLLDQALSYIDNGTIDVSILRKMLGYTPVELIEKYVEIVSSSRIDDLIGFIDEIYNLGVDFLQFSKDLLNYFMDMLLIKLEVTAESKIKSNNIKVLKDRFSKTKLAADIQLLLKLVEDIKKSDFPKIFFQIYSIKLTEQYKDLDQILSLINLKQGQQGSNGNINQNEKDINILWEKLVEKIRVEKPLIYSFLINTEAVIKGQNLIIYFPNKYIEKIAQDHIKVLESYVSEFIGKDIKVIYEIKSKVQDISLNENNQVSDEKNLLAVPLKTKKTLDPEIDKFLKVFNGKIVDNKKGQDDD